MKITTNQDSNANVKFYTNADNPEHTDFEKEMDDDASNFEMDDELFELRQRYIEMKKDRAKSEKDSNLLENKLKLLETEEQKVNIHI